MNKSMQILFLCAVVLMESYLVDADTLTMTATNNMTPGVVGTKKSVTDSLVLSSSDTTFLRDGVDSASFTYRYRAQASAEGAGAGAGATGYLSFGFSLTPAVWRIQTSLLYNGAVAVSSSTCEAGASDLVLSSTGLGFPGLSRTLAGASRTTTGGSNFGLTKPVFNTTTNALTGSGSIRLALEYGAQCAGAAESYVCLGQTSPLAAFVLDDTWFDTNDGIEMIITFVPSLNFTGQTADWDLTMISGEILSGYGMVNGDVTCTSGGTIHPTGTGLVIGDAASPTGFTFREGVIEVTEGDLEIRDWDAADFGSGYGGSDVTIDNGHVLTVKNVSIPLNPININSGTLKTATFTGSSINNTGGTLAAYTSPQDVDINGNYTQGADGTLLVKIGASSHDTYYVSGNTTLAGTLKVEVLPGFVPAVGQVFTFLYTTGTENGKFTNFDLQAPPAGFFWDVTRVEFYNELQIVADNGAFNFDDAANDTQGWWLDGVYGDSGIGPTEHTFDIGKTSGNLRLYDGTTAANPDDWWIIKLRSPDLSNSTYWQNAVGFSCRLQDEMSGCGYIGGNYWCTDLHANLYVKVFDVDQQLDRYFYSGTAEYINTGPRGYMEFIWGNIETFPANGVIKDIEVYIWGEEWAILLLEDYVILDEVEPITCVNTADVTGDCHVMMDDLAELSRQWFVHSLSPCPSADFDYSCSVNFDDLLIMAEQWCN